MSKLCTQMNSLLTVEVIKRLNQRKIFTVLDLLQEDSEKLVHMTRLPYKSIIKLQHNLIANYSAFPCNGLDTYDDLVANSAIISTGISSVDDLLEGGFLTGNLYEICGLSGTGKTELCITIAANIAHSLKQPVHYIDAQMAFSGKKVQNMLELRGCNEEEIGDIMERINVTQIQTPHELITFLHQLKSNLLLEQYEKSGARLVIVDSLPTILFPFLGENSNNRLGFMNIMVNTMKYLALEYHIVFLVVNLITKWFDEETVSNDNSVKNTGFEHGVNIHNHETVLPSLGRYWLHVPSTRLYVKRSDCGIGSQLNVIKSINSLGQPKSCMLAYTDQGFM